MGHSNSQILLKCLMGVMCVFLLSSVSAEDIEIFDDETPPAKPNILFVLDQSGSMGITISGGTQTRLDVLRNAFNTVMSDPGLTDVNLGLQGFSNGRSTPFPHGVSFPIAPIDDEATPIMLSNLSPFGASDATTVGYFTLADDTLPDPVAGERVREFLPRILMGWNSWGNTPLVDAYYEAALYFRGDKPKWGLATPEQNHAAHPSTYNGSSQGTINQVLTGNTLTCNAPDCGINCTGFINQEICPTGDTTCFLGTNCSTVTETWTSECALGTEADCLASDPRFTSCTSNSTTNCSNNCISGVYHPETGLCIPDALNSFTIKTHAPNMCLEVNGQNLTQEVCDGTAEQIFYSTPVSGQYVNIRSSNDRCIHVVSTSNMAAIEAHGCGTPGINNQAFDVSGSTIVAGHSGKCLNVPHYSTDSGETLVQYTCEGRTNQDFVLSNEATTCATNSSFLCQYPQDVTRCDRQKYRCDEVRDEVTLNSNDIVYNSPITDKCENNAIVLLSDGQPYVPDRLQYAQTMVDVKAMTGMTTDCAGTDDGRCGAELARFLSTQDQSSDVDGDNLINTYTIGFDVAAGSAAETFLKGVANAGGGSYFPATNAAALAAVFKAIIADVSKTARSYASPAYTVDPSSLLSHSRNVYIPLFENSAAPRWSGNLKKFKLNDKGQIVDSNGNVAVSADGVLDANASDFWSVTGAGARVADRPNPVTGGGVANLLDPASRNLFTDDGRKLVALSTATRRQLQGTQPNAISDVLHKALLRFIQGYADDGTPRHHLGDILHSKPTVVSYGAGKEVIFFGTNEGFLHAINAGDAANTGGGKELFAFMPSPLLENIRGQYENNPLTGSIKRIYGVDGEMSVWIDDKNNNGQVDSGSGETAYLYFGLRRGGNGYYAINITDPARPTLAWSISDRSPKFVNLGQTWSKPTIAKLRHKSGTSTNYEEVLVFGGGYDADYYDEEDVGARPNGARKGNGVYIVSAKTGDLIWSFSGGALEDSVPGNIRVLDMDRNGSIDRLYFGDLGGNVWRADLNVDDVDDDASVHDVRKDARAYRFASLGDGAGTDKRKFFYEPDVSLFKHKGRLVTVVTIGSGYRSHPMNTNISDRFFVLYDENAVNVPKTPPAALDEGDLASSAVLAGKDFLPTYKGWYKDLTNGKGEKSLSSPLIFMNKVMFTTFGLLDTPTSIGGADSCTVKVSNFGRAYALDLMTASATSDLDDDGTVTKKDESVIITYGEIPDSPKLVFNKPTDCTKDGCDQFVDVRVGKKQTPLIDKDTVDGNVNLGGLLPKVFWVD